MQSQNDHIGIPQAAQRDKQGPLIPVLAVLCLICGIQIATQTFAHLFNYQPQLGAHFHHIYPPWAIFEWLYQWVGQFEQAFQLAGSAGILFVSTGFIILFVVQRVLTNTTRASKKCSGPVNLDNLLRAFFIIDRRHMGLNPTVTLHGCHLLFMKDI